MFKINAQRAWLISDTHFGIRSNSKEWLDNMESYFQNFFIPKLIQNFEEGDVLIHCGDIFDSRNSLNLLVLNKCLDIFERIAEILPVYMIIGNHDAFLKSSNEINSLRVFKNMNNIHVFERVERIMLGKRTALMMPWNDTHEKEFEIINNPKYHADLVFCHTDIRGFTFNKQQKIEEGNTIDCFKNFERVYSGHIHWSQYFKNVRMLGSPYELTRSDSGNKKSIWILNLNDLSEIEIVNNYSPRFLKFNLKWILEQDMQKINNLFHNNYVDINLDPEMATWFPFSSFTEILDGDYKKIKYNITSIEQTMTETDEHTDIKMEQMNILGLLKEHIDNLSYNDQFKDKILKAATQIYNKVIQKTNKDYIE